MAAGLSAEVTRASTQHSQGCASAEQSQDKAGWCYFRTQCWPPPLPGKGGVGFFFLFSLVFPSWPFGSKGQS